MSKITVILSKPIDMEGFNIHFHNIHLPILRSLPNVKNIYVQRVTNYQGISTEPFILTQFEFDNETIMNEALSSEIGERLYADAENLLKYLPCPPTILFSSNYL